MHCCSTWVPANVQVVIMADGQVTQGSEIVKPNVRKVRRINDDVIGGFAGRTADKCCNRLLLLIVKTEHAAPDNCAAARRRHSRRVHIVREAGTEARGAPRAAHTGSRGAGQGLAHRQVPAAPGCVRLHPTSCCLTRVWTSIGNCLETRLGAWSIACIHFWLLHGAGRHDSGRQQALAADHGQW